jgi:hypothetical protein
MTAAEWNARDAVKALVLAHVGPLTVIAACTLLSTAMLWAIHQRDVAHERIGRLEEIVRVQDSVLKVQKPVAVKYDTVVRYDTKTVTRTVARVDSLRDTLLVHLTDTVRVKEYVTRTDSALKACRDLSNDCDTFRAAAMATIRAQEFKITALQSVKPRPSLLHDAGRFLVGVGAGVLLSRLK